MANGNTPLRRASGRYDSTRQRSGHGSFASLSCACASLDAACDSLRCRWAVEEGSPRRLVVTALPPAEAPLAADHRAAPALITLRVADGDARDLVKSIAEAIGAGVELDPAFQGKISLELRDVPWRAALSTVCERAGCEWSLQEGRGKKVLQVKVKPGRPKAG